MTTQKTSDFYWACRNGDIDTVTRMLRNLTTKDINRMEPNGSTALHAASFYGHADIVRLLLERDGDITIRNKYNKTALEEASTDRVRSIFDSAARRNEAERDDNDIPQSECVQLYPKAEDMDKCALVTRLLQAKLNKYHNNIDTKSIALKANYMEEKYHKACEEEKKRYPFASNAGDQHFKKYRATGDFSSMITFYTTGTPFYKVIDNDEALVVDMYKRLLTTDKFAYQGRSYCGLNLHSKDFESYRWALAHPKSLLEIREKMSTSIRRKEALDSIENTMDEHHRVLLEFYFPQPCFTTIHVEAFREFTNEVVIIPGTFFEVTHMQEDRKNLTIILLKNVSADKSTLLTT